VVILMVIVWVMIRCSFVEGVFNVILLMGLVVCW